MLKRSYNHIYHFAFATVIVIRELTTSNGAEEWAISNQHIPKNKLQTPSLYSQNCLHVRVLARTVLRLHVSEVSSHPSLSFQRIILTLFCEVKITLS